MLLTNDEIYAAGTSVEKVLRLAPILGRIDVLALNRKEAESLLGVQDSTQNLAKDIVVKLRSDRSLVLVSDGAAPSALCSKNTVTTSRPPDVNLVSANGAGDAMTGAFFEQVMHSKVDNAKMWTNANLSKILSFSLSEGASFAASSSELAGLIEGF